MILLVQKASQGRGKEKEKGKNDAMMRMKRGEECKEHVAYFGRAPSLVSFCCWYYYSQTRERKGNDRHEGAEEKWLQGELGMTTVGTNEHTDGKPKRRQRVCQPNNPRKQQY